MEIRIIIKQSQETKRHRQTDNFQLLREGGVWKLSEITGAANDLAAALVKAASEEEQERLLAPEKDLMDRSLIAALNELTDFHIQKGEYAQARGPLSSQPGLRKGSEIAMSWAMRSLIWVKSIATRSARRKRWIIIKRASLFMKRLVISQVWRPRSTTSANSMGQAAPIRP
jgi:hypothetical protein